MPISISQRCEEILKSHNLQVQAVFENLGLAEQKFAVKTNVKSLAGVYLIINLFNGKIYVGSAITGRIYNRFHKHIYGFTGNKFLAIDVIKHGISNFAFVLLKTIPEIVKQEDNKALLEIENYYIELLCPDYNIAKQAGNTFGILHTEETKNKMRLNYSSERRQQVGSLNRGKKLSKKTIELIRSAAIIRSPISQETRDKVSLNSASANLYEIVKINDSNTKKTIVVRTIAKVAEICDCSNKTIQRALQGNGIVKKT